MLYVGSRLLWTHGLLSRSCKFGKTKFSVSPSCVKRLEPRSSGSLAIACSQTPGFPGWNCSDVCNWTGPSSSASTMSWTPGPSQSKQPRHQSQTGRQGLQSRKVTTEDMEPEAALLNINGWMMSAVKTPTTMLGKYSRSMERLDKILASTLIPLQNLVIQ